MYADCCDDARETFTFLEQHGVGAQQVSIYHACKYDTYPWGVSYECECVCVCVCAYVYSPKHPVHGQNSAKKDPSSVTC